MEQMDRIFSPRAIAVVGASVNPDKVGYMCLTNILDGGYCGQVYPVNPSLTEAFGVRAFPSVGAIPGEVDLAVIVVPAAGAVAAFADCIAKGVSGAVLVTSGFKEVGTTAGADLQKEVADIARQSGVQLIGPNTLGVLNPHIHMNATFEGSLGEVSPGKVAVVTQSGGMCFNLCRTLHNHGVGLSKALGVGNRAGVDFDGLIRYLGEDPKTGVIVLYVEGLEQPRGMMNAVRGVAGRKPVVALKGGRAESSNPATLSHTGALAGRDELYRAAFRQSGIIQVADMTELVDKTKALAFQAPAAGNRVTIVSSMGGPAVLMLDQCHKWGMELARFSPATWQRLRKVVSPLTSVDNPVDVSWDVMDFGRSSEIIRAIMEDDGVHGVVASIGGSALGFGFSRAAMELAADYAKPFVISTGPELRASRFQRTLFEGRGIPTYPAPDRAVTGVAALVEYGEIIRRMG